MSINQLYLWVDYKTKYAISATDELITIRDATGLPDGAWLYIEGEYVYATNKTAVVIEEDPNACTFRIQRSLLGSSSRSHDYNTTVWLRIPTPIPGSGPYSSLSFPVTLPGSRYRLTWVSDSPQLDADKFYDNSWYFTTLASLSLVHHGSMVRQHDGTYEMDGPASLMVNHTINVIAGLYNNDLSGTSIGLVDGIEFEDCGSLYITDGGQETDVASLSNYVPATPVVTLFGNTRIINPSVVATEDVIQYLDIEVFVGGTDIESVTIDWGDLVVDVLTFDGTFDDLGVPSQPSPFARIRTSHTYTTSGPHTIEVTVQDGVGDISGYTRELTVNCTVPSKPMFDQMQIERVEDTTSTHLTRGKYSHDWVDVNNFSVVQDSLLPTGQQYRYRVRYRRFSEDGRDRKLLPPDNVTQWSDWSVAI